ncbi:histidine--tRNA ligase [Cerasicoccus arenae]|uniref:Histidine--tRNA ligase n=1 Tax=Cerasicoccus arenae TaxID=424488 RepID=A0A8J3DAX4_9BACT|nr:histidine--tRNA ligase [Cerasicoccus arenae]MBK1856713.1 histidine--tRNA ligase [Cerasicoccus arenae]GHB99080.1 histidine--tRNA ligase [Cerasicoccus arenae]
MATHKTLPGFRDFYPEDCSLRNHLFSVWRQCAKRFGFQEYDGPILESLELLTAKSGDEIAGQLFNFEDKGGRAVTLRPELTPTLARMVSAKANALPRPIKWYSIGENFRYERQQKGRLRSFYQFNADILGEAGPIADAEVIGLLVESLCSQGLQRDEFIVRLSDRNLWFYFIESLGFTGEQATGALGIIDKMERMPPEKALAALGELGAPDPAKTFQAITDFQQLPDVEAIAAFLSKMDLSEESHDKLNGRLDAWRELLDLLDAAGLNDFVKLDLRIVRGLAYYTGFVFEAFQTVGKGRALAGGGRYDDLLEKLGGSAMPAVGFGMGDVTLRDLLEEVNRLPRLIDKADIFLVYTGDAGFKAALGDAYALRRQGLRAELPFREAGMGKQFKQAAQSGADFTLVYGPEELAQGIVQVKHMRTGEQKAVPAAQLVGSVLALWREG